MHICCCPNYCRQILLLPPHSKVCRSSIERTRILIIDLTVHTLIKNMHYVDV